MENSQKAIGFVSVQTKSNYKKLNGKHLPLIELAGRRVTCLVYDEVYAKWVTTDFSLNEIYFIELDKHPNNNTIHHPVSNIHNP